MDEQWRRLGEFPEYAVSDRGRVMNLETDLIKVPTKNQQGIPNVILMLNKEQYRRGVALLVATVFIPKPVPYFDTPINLDGDRTNNAVENLAWRPRWFAIKYHQQFKPGYKPALLEPIEEAQTHEEFENSLHAAITYGLLDNDIFLSILNNTIVFPTHQMFQKVV